MKKFGIVLLFISLNVYIFAEYNSEHFSKEEMKQCFVQNKIYSKDITIVGDFEIDIDGDKKNEVFKIKTYKNEEGFDSVKSISINNKKISEDILVGAYYIQFIKINGKTVLGFGYSDNGVDPSSRFYEYKNGSLKLIIEEEISYVMGVKENKIFSWWDSLFGENWEDKYEVKKENYTKYYDIDKKEWVINRDIIGKKVKNNFKDLLIFKKSNVEVELKGEVSDNNSIKYLTKIYNNNKNKIAGILKKGENFEILSYEEGDIFHIRTGDGKKGYIDRKHMVYD